MGEQQGAPALLMDRAYEGDPTRELAAALRWLTVVPPMPQRSEPWEYDRELYKERNIVERLFSRLKRFRHLATRYDKLDALFLGFIHLARA